MEEIATRRFLTFDLDKVVYAVEVERVEVVLEMAAITRVPRAPDHLRGVINYRGTVIPVADLRVRFGMGEADLAESGSIVVLQINPDGDPITIGVIADGVREVVDLEAAKIAKTPTMGMGKLEGMVMGVYEREGGFVMILDIDKAFRSEAVAGA